MYRDLRVQGHPGSHTAEYVFWIEELGDGSSTRGHYSRLHTATFMHQLRADIEDLDTQHRLQMRAEAQRRIQVRAEAERKHAVECARAATVLRESTKGTCENSSTASAQPSSKEHEQECATTAASLRAKNNAMGEKSPTASVPVTPSLFCDMVVKQAQLWIEGQSCSWTICKHSKV